MSSFFWMTFAAYSTVILLFSVLRFFSVGFSQVRWVLPIIPGTFFVLVMSGFWPESRGRIGQGMVGFLDDDLAHTLRVFSLVFSCIAGFATRSFLQSFFWAIWSIGLLLIGVSEQPLILVSAYVLSGISLWGVIQTDVGPNVLLTRMNRSRFVQFFFLFVFGALLQTHVHGPVTLYLCAFTLALLMGLTQDQANGLNVARQGAVLVLALEAVSSVWAAAVLWYRVMTPLLQQNAEAVSVLQHAFSFGLMMGYALFLVRSYRSAVGADTLSAVVRGLKTLTLFYVVSGRTPESWVFMGIFGLLLLIFFVVLVYRNDQTRRSLVLGAVLMVAVGFPGSAHFVSLQRLGSRLSGQLGYISQVYVTLTWLGLALAMLQLLRVHFHKDHDLNWRKSTLFVGSIALFVFFLTLFQSQIERLLLPQNL